MKKFIATLLVLAVTVSAYAKKPNVYNLPKDVTFAIGISYEALDTKLTKEKLEKKKFYKKFTKKLYRGKRRSKAFPRAIHMLMEKPDSLGVDQSQDIVGFMQWDGKSKLGGVMVSLSTTSKIERLKKLLVEDVRKDTLVSYSKGAVNYIVADDIFMAWNKKVLFFGGGERDVEYEDVDSLSWSENWDIEKALEKQATLEMFKEWLPDLLKTKKSKSLGKSKLVPKNVMTGNDAWFYVDYGSIFKQTKKWSGLNKDLKKEGIESGELFEKLEEIRFHGKLNLEGNKLKLDYTSEAGKAMFELYEGVYNKKLNKHLFKFIPKDVIGIGTGAFDFGQAMEQSLNLYKPMFAGAKKEKARMVYNTIHLLQVALDEKAIGNILHGDIAYGVTSIAEKEHITTKYVYDENYDYTEVPDTTTRMVPNIVLMSTIGDKSSVDAILNLIETAKGIKKKDGYYTIKMKKSVKKFLGTTYLFIHDNILFATNDSNYVFNVVKKGGYSKDQQLDVKLQNELANSIASYYINAEQLVDQLKFKSKRAKRKMKKLPLKDTFKDMKVTMEYKGKGVSTAHMTVTSNTDRMFLDQLFILFDAMYKL